MRILNIPIPFHGRLSVDDCHILIVSNCIPGLDRDPHPNQINIDIQVGSLKIRKELLPLLGEIVRCFPNDNGTKWEVEKV